MPQPYKLEEVKQWFGKLTIINDSRINRHLQSLSNYGDNPVNSTDTDSATAWYRIFNECLSDLENINNDSVEHYRGKFNEEYRNFTSDLNLNLNTITKKDFVELFAATMNYIFTKEKVEEEEKRKLRDELDKKRELKQKEYENEEESLSRFLAARGSGARFGITEGGSKKKSNKRIRRKRRDSRRNKTRKYKKRN